MNNKRTMTCSIFIILIIGIIIVLCNTIITIPTGSVGILTQFGAVKGNAIEAGMNVKIPFIQKVSLMNCQIQKLEVDASSASKDLQTVNLKVAINYSIDKTIATNLFKDIGINYQVVLINPAIQESIKAVSAQYTAEELIVKRAEVSSKMLENIKTKLSNKGINVTELNIINFDFSAEFNKAIEAKQVAQQNTLKSQQDLERIKVEAEQTIIKARAEAESMRLQRQELTNEYISLKQLEVQSQGIAKWNGVLSTTMLSSDVNSLLGINVNK